LDRVEERVKTPAIVEPGEILANIISSLFLYFIPAAWLEKVTPLITGSFGNPVFGARGDNFKFSDIRLNLEAILKVD
jgi:hypothetical protein